MSFLGKLYKYDAEENFADFVDNLGAPAEIATALKSFKPEQKFEKNGDEYTFYTSSPRGPINLKFKSGVEFDEKINTIVAKTTFTVNGNTVEQVQKFDDGGEVTTKREFSDDKLVVTLKKSGWDGVAYRYYKA